MEWEKVTITDLEAVVSPEIMNRGIEYHQAGHVLRACCWDCFIAGEVAGTGGIYRVQLTIDNDRIDGSCSCPYPGFCKHMVALTLARIEKSVEFQKLEPVLQEVMANPEQLRDLLIRLIRKDPFNFLDLINTAAPEDEFVNSRGILNLIRNTFRGPLLTTEQIEAQWERIKRIEELITKAIANREKEAPELLGALLKGVSDSYRDCPGMQLEKVFRDLLPLAKDLQKGWAGEEIITFLGTLWEIYFDFSLWELADSVRPVLADFYGIIPEWFLDKLGAVEWRNLERPQIILLYEFFALAAQKGLATAGYFKKVAEVLNETTEGQLWLIDRTLEEDPDRAYLMAKEGLRKSNGENKRAFRERLIGIHLRRGEKKQAASLSFIQFQEEPNLQEYQRLKGILAGSRSEFSTYLKKMDQIIEAGGLEELAAEIAFDREDWVKLEEKLGKIRPEDPFLKELAKQVTAENRVVPKEIFQAVISRLLAGGRANWEAALSLMVVYKKLCLNNSRNEEWNSFRAALNGEYGEDRKFTRKFGAVLAG